jgi:hypothetical protein
VGAADGEERDDDDVDGVAPRLHRLLHEARRLRAPLQGEPRTLVGMPPLRPPRPLPGLWALALRSIPQPSYGPRRERALLALSTQTPDDDEAERLRTFANEYHAVVSAAEAAHQSTVTALSDAASDLGHLGPAFDLLSQSERELSLPFTYTAKTLDALRELFLRQVQAEHVDGLSALLAFNAGMAASLKDVLKNRDTALAQCARPQRTPHPRPSPPHPTQRRSQSSRHRS